MGQTQSYAIRRRTHRTTLSFESHIPLQLTIKHETNECIACIIYNPMRFITIIQPNGTATEVLQPMNIRKFIKLFTIKEGGRKVATNNKVNVSSHKNITEMHI